MVLKKGEEIMKKFLAALLSMLLLMGCLATVSYAASAYVYFSGDCNVRTGPGLGYASIGSVNQGSTLTYLNEYSVDNRGVTWYKVSFRSSCGWVSSVYATPTSVGGNATYGGGYGPDGSTGGNNFFTTNPTVTYVRATGRVNVRSGPGVGYDSINTMEEGEQVVYLGNSSYDSRGVLWYQVQYYSFGAYWVSSTYAELVTSGTAGVSSTAPIVGSYVKATGGKSSLRTGPALSYDVLCTIQKDEIATYLGNSSVDERGRVWYYVNFGGTVGWVSSRYTTLY